MADHKFKTGDLVLCKVGSYDPWPSVVFPQKLLASDVYSKRKADKIVVRFFQDQTYSWSLPKRLIPLSKNDIKKHLKDKKPPKSSKDLYAAYQEALDFTNLHEYLINLNENSVEFEIVKTYLQETGADEIKGGEDPFKGKPIYLTSNSNQNSGGSSSSSSLNKRNKTAGKKTPVSSPTPKTASKNVEKRKHVDNAASDNKNMNNKQNGIIDGPLKKKQKMLDIGLSDYESDLSPFKKSSSNDNLIDSIVTSTNNSSSSNNADGSGLNTSVSSSDKDTHNSKNNASLPSSSSSSSSNDSATSLDSSATNKNINGNIPNSTDKPKQRRIILHYDRRLETCMLFRRKIQITLIQSDVPATDEQLKVVDGYFKTMYERSKKDSIIKSNNTASNSNSLVKAEDQDKNKLASLSQSKEESNQHVFFDLDSLRQSKLPKLLKTIINTPKLQTYHNICKKILLEWQDYVEILKKEKSASKTTTTHQK